MKLGIVGLPNVGKSTLFKAITNAGAQSANYPFCTIEPNIGVVAVPDQRLDKLAEMYHPEKYTPATIEFVDIAGLVRGALASPGELCIIPLADYLALGAEARINTPSTLGGSNWVWRALPGQLCAANAKKIAALAVLYGRA